MHKVTNYITLPSNYIYHELHCRYASLCVATLDLRLGRPRDGAHLHLRPPHSRRISDLRSLLQSGGPSRLSHLCMNLSPLLMFPIILIICIIAKNPAHTQGLTRIHNPYARCAISQTLQAFPQSARQSLGTDTHRSCSRSDLTLLVRCACRGGNR